MSLFSYHIFYFAFRWSLHSDKSKIFSEKTDLKRIPVSSHSMWERVQIKQKPDRTILNDNDIQEAKELFNERQYYFDFIHPILYDIEGSESSLIQHYERKEPKNNSVKYIIQVKDKRYELRVDAINMNLYSTGVGIMSFYLINDDICQKDEYSIRDINQFGRRIMPPCCIDFETRERIMLASLIKISGLLGKTEDKYEDNFNYKIRPYGNERGLDNVWQPAKFILELIDDLSPELDITPVIDDRMLVNCWYGNDEFAKQATNHFEDFKKGDFWYKYVFVDNGNDETCQNDKMKEKLVNDATYDRWQKYGTLYGVTRYSFVALSSSGFELASTHMRTIYSRMFELIILQRASMLHFSSEVTKVSSLIGNNKRNAILSISSLYKEYIRFINQIYFRSVTIQDQGIELYDMLMEQFSSGEKIKELDAEIEELYQYITLMADQKRGENGEKLNILAATFLPATLLTGIYGMNKFEDLEKTTGFWGHILIIIIISIIVFYIIKKWRQ